MRACWWSVVVLACHGVCQVACNGAVSTGPIPQYADESRGGDRDGDGAADQDDACGDDAEDGLMPKANDGCPADDPDQDGIARGGDECPNAKEDGAEPKPADGCPGADADGDGVADAKDACPEGQEDNLGDKPSDGCPADDRDGDGIADVRDGCPDGAESHNGYKDADGCPDDEPADATVSYDPATATIYVPTSKKIDFARGSTALDARASATVADVAKILADHPEIQRLEIEGHASSDGEPKYNVNLTERRAIEVARALTRRGTDGKRLVPIGYGEYCPAVDKGDGQDIAENRRVLFKVVVVNGVWQSAPRGCWRAQAQGIDPTARKPGVPAPPPPMPWVPGL
jgi:outer membrane protein OmpA-like peptidoglycan-associated protein